MLYNEYLCSKVFYFTENVTRSVRKGLTMLHKRRVVIIGLFIGLLGIISSFIPFVNSLEENTDLGLLFKLRGPRQTPQEVVIINMDKSSAEKLNLPDNPEKWPRSFHALLVKNLVTLGATVIAFDIFFEEPTSSENDTAFAKAIGNASNVVLCESLKKETIPLYDDKGSYRGDAYVVKLIQPIPLLTQSALASAPFPLPKVPVKISQYWTFKASAGDKPTFPVTVFQAFALTQYNEFIRLLEKFYPSVKNKLPQSKDEIIRSKSVIDAIQIFRDIFKNKPHIAEKMMKDLEKIRTSAADTRKTQILKSLIRIYHGCDCRYLNFYGPPCTITTIPYYQVLQFPEEMSDKQARSYFDGKVVFIGTSGNLRSAQKDGFYTVFSRPDGLDLSGVEIAATAFANLLEDIPVQPLKSWKYLTVIFMWGAVAGILCHTLPSLISALSVTGISALYLVIALYQFKAAGTWYPLAIPLFFQVPLAFFSGIVCKYTDTNKERNNIRTAFRYYIPDEVVEQLSKNITDLKTHNQLVYGTCLSTDAERYTSLSETMSPRELRTFINKYYEAIFEPIKQHGGLITNIVGDSVLALWVAMHRDEIRRKQACISAFDIEQRVHQFNQSSPCMQLPTRIGLHSGHVLLGNVGAVDHYEYRPIGDIVNTATRIEGLNKYLGTRILVSGEVITQLDDFIIRDLGKFLFVGKSKPLEIYELLCLKEKSNRIQRDLCLFFSEALDAFKRQSWYEAMEKFYKLIKIYGEDGPSLFFIALCKKNREKQFDESWNGAICMDKK